MKRLSLVAVTASVASMLGCGPLFCVDADQCWGPRTNVDTWRDWDTWDRDEPEPETGDTGDTGAPTSVELWTVRIDCEGGAWALLADAGGTVIRARLLMGQPGVLIEEHPIERLTWSRDATQIEARLWAVGDYAPGELTTFDCPERELLGFALYVDGEANTACAAWGPGAEEIAPECPRWD